MRTKVYCQYRDTRRQIQRGRKSQRINFPVHQLWAEVDGACMQDLSWEDREKVLRLLFARLNDPNKQAFFEKMPEHALA